jgi:hypothetical protein
LKILFCGIFAAFICCAGVTPQEKTDAPQRKIPLLISDHHADHALWLLRQTGAGGAGVSLVVLDAHADTAANPDRRVIQEFIRARQYEQADCLIKNHNWIHPLAPRPIDTLVWISKISGFPDTNRLGGFMKSTAFWDMETARCVTLDELDTVSVKNDTLVVSIDLDFFYNENYTPNDIPSVFDKLFEFSVNRNANVFWAVCISLAWLPDVDYGWQLLEQSLAWLISKNAFAAPLITVFTSNRYDTSRKAESFRAGGTAPPSFYLKEDTMPGHIKRLFGEMAPEE